MNLDPSFWFAVTIGALMFGAIGMWIGGDRYSGTGFFLGLLLGPLGLLIVAIMLASAPTSIPTQRKPIDLTLKKCPECAETIQMAARKCRYCGSDVSATIPR